MTRTQAPSPMNGSWMRELLAEAVAMGSATVHEAAGQTGALPAAIRPVDPMMQVCGPAFTVSCAAGHNVFIHEAVYAAPPGSVLVVATEEAHEGGYWGDILTTAARHRNLAGVVIDGGARDAAQLRSLGFPVFSRGLCIKGTGKSRECGGIGAPVQIGGVLVATGDLVVGDVDGVVVVSAERVSDTLRAARERVVKEADTLARLAAGETTLEIYGF